MSGRLRKVPLYTCILLTLWHQVGLSDNQSVVIVVDWKVGQLCACCHRCCHCCCHRHCCCCGCGCLCCLRADLTSSDKLHQHQEQDVSPSVLSGSSAATSNSACHDSGSSLPWAELCVLDTHSVADKQSMTAAAAASATAAASSLFHSLPVQLGMLSPSTLPGAAAPVAAASSTLLHTGSVPCNTAHIPAAAAALGTLGAGATLSVHQQQTVGLEAGSLHNPFAAMMPSPNSPGLAEGMLAAFGMTSPTTASTSGSRAATTAGGATGT